MRRVYIWQYLKVKKLYCLKLTPKSLPHAVNVQVTTHACLLPSVSSHIFFTYPTPKHFLTYYTKIKTISMWYTQARPLKSLAHPKDYSKTAKYLVNSWDYIFSKLPVFTNLWILFFLGFFLELLSHSMINKYNFYFSGKEN